MHGCCYPLQFSMAYKSVKKNPTADGLMKEMHAIEEFIAKLEYREKQSNQTLSKIPGIEKWESKNMNQIR